METSDRLSAVCTLDMENFRKLYDKKSKFDQKFKKGATKNQFQLLQKG